MEYALTSMALASLTSMSSCVTGATTTLLTRSIQSTFETLKSFVSKHHTYINEVLVENDLNAKLEIISALMDDIETKWFKKKTISIEKSLYHLHQTVDKIHFILKAIDAKISYHKTRYFSMIRSLNYEDEIISLKKEIKVLDSRYNMFIDVIRSGSTYS